MKNKVFSITVIVIAIAFLIVGLLVSVSIWNSRTVAIRQAEQSLENLCQRYAAEFDAEFSESEMLVNDMASVVYQEYTVKDYAGNRAFFIEKKAQTKKLIKDVIAHSRYPIGLYLTYAPENSGGMDEIWYQKKVDGKIEYINSVEISDGWLPEGDPSTEYYYHTLEEGKALWWEASYDPGMEGEVVSYTVPLYDENDDLIGVIGADIMVDHIFADLKKIDKATGGKSALIDNAYGIVSGPDMTYYKDSSKYIYAQAEVGDRWTIAMIQPVRKAIGSVMATAAAVILLGILILIAAIITIQRISRYKVQPIVAETELKDALMIHQARQAKMGEMVGNIAHQWKQPLNGMKMALMNMEEDREQGDLDDETFEDYIARMKMMASHLAETADDFTAFLKPGKKTEHFSAGEETRRMVRLMDEQIRLAGITVEITGPEVWLEGYRNEFGQCMFNLIDNAREALAGSSDMKILVTTEIDGGRSRIRVYNNGAPIPKENQERIFDLYYTTKEDTEGTGIGLYLAREIIREHFNGDLYCHNADGGVEFIIDVPVLKEDN